jgi:hypothetical protein
VRFAKIGATKALLFPLGVNYFLSIISTFLSDFGDFRYKTSARNVPDNLFHKNRRRQYINFRTGISEIPFICVS